jgi:hypothetical protein
VLPFVTNGMVYVGQMLWNSVVVEAYGREPDKRLLGGIKVKNVKTGDITDFEVRLSTLKQTLMYGSQLKQTLWHGSQISSRH